MPIELPYIKSETTQINDNQRIASTVNISKEGLMVITCEFWNDNQIDGDTYSAQAVALDANNDPVAACGNVQGLDARFGGEATYKTGRAETQIPADVLARIEKVAQVHSLPNTKDDAKIAEEFIKDIAGKLGIDVEKYRKWFQR